ncbi:hypothetical protein [Rosistilla carotiformis]|nr:hypothetical protein [Rosistilla carotiformis]
METSIVAACSLYQSCELRVLDQPMLALAGSARRICETANA